VNGGLLEYIKTLSGPGLQMDAWRKYEKISHIHQLPQYIIMNTVKYRNMNNYVS